EPRYHHEVPRNGPRDLAVTSLTRKRGTRRIPGVPAEPHLLRLHRPRVLTMKATMKSRSARVLATLLMVLPLIPMGCKSLDVPDDNASSLGDLQSNPTPATIAAAATGIVAGFRLLDRSRSVAYTEQTSMMGRESYTLDRSFPSDPPRRLVGPKAALINVPSAP